MNKEKASRSVRFGQWLSKKNVARFAFSSVRRVQITIFIFVLLTHSIYWVTAWWSPWPYLILNALAVWFGQGVFKPWGTIVSQSITNQWSSGILKITVPFVVLNYIALFACLYMFGSIIDSSGKPIEGAWQHFYFSAVTLTTLGYGNIVPNDLCAEIIAVIQSIIGFMGFAILAGVVASIALKKSEAYKSPE